MSKELQCGPLHKTIVDDDFEPPERFRLHMDSHGYPTMSRHGAKYAPGKWRKESVRIHRFVMGMNADDDMQVDHINCNQLDNRRENLRKCTSVENMRNRLSKGASFNKGAGRWRAQVHSSGKRVHLGYFDTEREAIEASNSYKIANFGAFARPYPINESIINEAMA